MRILPAWLAAALFAGAAPLFAQTASPSPPASAILTINQDRLYSESAWGKRAAKHLTDISAALAAENRDLEAKLVSEEKALTNARPTMDPEAFRKAADAFDARVVELRSAQDAKGRAIGRISDAERQRFYAAALPVMGEVLRERGAVVVLDSRAIFVSADSIDVTDDMIASIDAKLGAGEDATDPAPEPTPAPVPQPAPAPAPGANGGN
ncbi:MAG TPA: OmpH family outer membrane protein [Albidovulum sp.]|uniref:OmpH family outer membrane protein n=1 Tax=Albidovulum sp. TaxID=1872424 RepID=UPI002B5C7996|nr:OmpH family outer membrane protein [Albidovulum sp.]